MSVGKETFQDLYPDNLSHCYCCGRLNENGLQIKSYWRNEEESVCLYTPDEKYIALPGFVYGGLIASLIDCHSTGTAFAAAYRSEGREMGTNPPLRFVTASLRVDYIKPTPLGKELEIVGKVKEIKGKKVIVTSEILVDGVVTVKGEVVAVKMPDSMCPS